MGLCLGFLGLFFFLDNQGAEIAKSLSWLPIVSLVGFVIVYCVGFGPLPWAVFGKLSFETFKSSLKLLEKLHEFYFSGEMFPPNTKSVGSTIVTSVCWILGFAVTKWYSSLEVVIGTFGAFWLFGVLCCVGFFFVLFMVMETKGLSLQQIQDKLNGR